MPTTTATETAPRGKEIAMLAGGRFWCLEAVYDQMKGVQSVKSGYIAGAMQTPL